MVKFDGNISFAGGQSSGLLADRIGKDQYAAGVNITTRNGGISPRPRFVQIPLRFESAADKSAYYLSLRGGKFQCSCYYRSDSGEHIIVAINGRIFAIDPLRGIVQHVPLPKRVANNGREYEDTLHPRLKRVNFATAGRFLVLFDYASARPVIMDGLTARRASSETIYRKNQSGGYDELTIPEVPSSVIGTFVQNRLFVANALHEFGAGDPVGGINANAPVTFEESLSPGSPYNGQFFSLGTTNANNPITYMGYLQQADTSTGYGPLVVATDDSVYTFLANQPRANWEASQFGALSLFNAGIAGPRAAVNVNSDMMFMSADGQIRSLHMGRDEQTRWSSAPISREIANWLPQPDGSNLLRYTAAGVGGNRVFFSAKPFLCKGYDEDNAPFYDIAFHGMVVLELDNVSGIGYPAKPAWAGMWQGIRPMEFVEGSYAGQQMMHVWSKDPGGINNLYAFSDSSPHDVFEGRTSKVVSRIRTRLYDWDARFAFKHFKGFDIKVSDVTGAFTADAKYRPASAGPMAAWQRMCAGVKTNCEGFSRGDSPQSVEPVTLQELHFGSPKAALSNPVTKEQSDGARSCQVQLTIEGSTWMLEDIRITADDSDDGGRITNGLTKCPPNLASSPRTDCNPGDDPLDNPDDWGLTSVATRAARPQPCKECDPCPPAQPSTLCDPCLTN